MTASRLPLLISVPHAGLEVPEQLAPLCVLTPKQISEDGDETAREIYEPLRERVAEFVTTSIARAFVDQNRARDDVRKDGVVKTHTCWDVPIYREQPSDECFEQVLRQHYDPYHRELTARAAADVELGVDCHTMAAFGPPVGPDPGVERPLICLGDADGKTLPEGWMRTLAECFAEAFGEQPAINVPFSGGYITRHHGLEMPWVQLELSRTDRLTPGQKGRAVRRALEAWVARRVRE